MTAPASWVSAAVARFLNYLSRGEALELVKELQAIPVANKSLRSTLDRLRAELEKPA
jgi:hypothetical protein